jgi:flagellar biosynthetic protein FliO
VENADFLALVLRLGLSLAVVLGLMAAAVWVLRRRALLVGRLGAQRPVTVLARQSLGGKASVQVVQVADRALVLGVTEQTVTLLAEGDAEVFTPVGTVVGPARTAVPVGHDAGAEVVVDVRRRPGQARTTLVDAVKARYSRR